MPMIKHAIIVAGGKGKRMKSPVPKQFMMLAGKPVLMHTIDLFQHHIADSGKIVVVLPSDQQEEWRKLCREFRFEVPHTMVIGGKERFFSVKNGLEMLEGSKGVVAIHDGVRPGVSNEVIEKCYQTAKKKGSAIPVVPVRESLRKQNQEGSRPVSRENIVLVQTPQTFQLEKIREAYNMHYTPSFTDDASVYEASGFQVTLVEGNKDNIKITDPSDLAFMQWLKKEEP